MRFQVAARAAVIACAFALAACGGAANSVPSASNATGSNGVHSMNNGGGNLSLPISAFLAVQGTCGVCGGTVTEWISENAVPGCPSGYNLYAYVDYFGLTDKAKNDLNTGAPLNLGTAETGTVLISTQNDGSAKVDVDLFTTNAYTYSFCTLPHSTPVLFGYTVAEVHAGKPAALASSEYHVVFTMPSAESPLPDLQQLAFFGGLPGYAFVSQKLTVTATGALRSQTGVADGTPGQMNLSEIGLTKLTGSDSDAFAAESERLTVLK